MKKQEIYICTTDLEEMGLTKNRKAIKIKFTTYNGETQLKGKWEDNNESFELPSHFFKPVKNGKV